MHHQNKKENIVYVALWALMFTIPVVSLYLRRLTSDSIFQWGEVFNIWRMFGVCFIFFVIHDVFIAPIIVYKGKKVRYVIELIILLVLAQAANVLVRPKMANIREIRSEQRREAFSDSLRRNDGFYEPSRREDATYEEGMRRRDDRNRPPRDKERNDEKMSQNNPPPRPRNRDNFRDEGNFDEPKKFAEPLPPAIFGDFDLFVFSMSLMLALTNLGLKTYFKSNKDKEILEQLEKKELENQLRYLHYQLSPHFFMNTLNNIHALITIDQKKAQETIETLSKLMRYVLYDSDCKTVSVSKEIGFTQNYIDLMRIRYTDKVKIETDFHFELTDALVPPLLFVTFVENAFKHGVSYQHETLIKISLSTDEEKIIFKCFNSKNKNSNNEKGGVGLINVKKRLDLIYDKRYKLLIDETENTYNIELQLPRQI